MSRASFESEVLNVTLRRETFYHYTGLPYKKYFFHFSILFYWGRHTFIGQMK